MLFDVSYARIVACSGCPISTTGSCGYVKCPRCGFEGSYERFVEVE